MFQNWRSCVFNHFGLEACTGLPSDPIPTRSCRVYLQPHPNPTELKKNVLTPPHSHSHYPQPRVDACTQPHPNPASSPTEISLHLHCEPFSVNHSTVHLLFRGGSWLDHFHLVHSAHILSSFFEVWRLEISLVLKSGVITSACFLALNREVLQQHEYLSR